MARACGGLPDRSRYGPPRAARTANVGGRNSITRFVGPSGDFAARLCGDRPYNLAIPGMPPVWVPDIDAANAALVHVEFVPDVSSSPLVEGTPVPEVVRQAVIVDLLVVFDRYREVLGDTQNPLQAVRVITNERAAVPCLAWVQNQTGCRGAVEVRSLGG
jgi:hypothetical protein